MAGADVHVPAHMIAEEAVQQDVFPVLSIGDARDCPGETRGGGIVHHRLLLLRGGGDRSRGVGAAPIPPGSSAADWFSRQLPRHRASPDRDDLPRRPGRDPKAPARILVSRPRTTSLQAASPV